MPAGRITRDGVRDTDPIFQQAIDRRIQALVREMHVSIHDLSGLGRNRWITTASSATLALIRGEPTPSTKKIDNHEIEMPT